MLHTGDSGVRRKCKARHVIQPLLNKPLAQEFVPPAITDTERMRNTFRSCDLGALESPECGAKDSVFLHHPSVVGIEVLTQGRGIVGARAEGDIDTVSLGGGAIAGCSP